MKQTRTHYSAEEKVALLRRHLEQGEAVSKLCEDQGLRPTVFYRWKKEFFEGGAAAFERSLSRQTAPLLERIQAMEQDIILFASMKRQDREKITAMVARPRI